MSVLTHKTEGDGPPILLLNGGMMSLGAWEPIAQRLVAAGNRVVRCDFRGQLLSPGPARTRLEDVADDVAALLDALGLSSVDVVSASYGAFTGLYLAARHPARVASIVCATVMDHAGSGGESLGEPGERLARAVRAAARGGDRAEVYDAIVHLAYTPEWRATHAAELAERRAMVPLLPDEWFTGLEGLLVALEAADLRPLLPSVRCPALVIAAGRDAAMPLARNRAVADGIEGATFVVVPDSGHALVVEKEDEFVKLALRFLERVRRERRAA